MSFTSAIVDYEKLPLFERLPVGGQHLLGFDRRSLEALHRYTLIRLVKVKLPEHKRPITLVHVPSLVSYVERVEQIEEAKRMAAIREGYAHHHLAPTLDEKAVEVAE